MCQDGTRTPSTEEETDKTATKVDAAPPAQERVPHNNLEGCLWPDPDPSPSTTDETSKIQVNDVSLMNETTVHRIVYPRTEQDVHDTLQDALDQNRKISMRGTQHSMGGQCLSENSILIDTRFLATMEYNANGAPSYGKQEDTDFSSVTVGSGCKWSDVIQFLNPFGKSPRTMQSYSSFSVGGSLAVNAHGVTSDHSLATDVLSFRLVRYIQDANDATKVCVETLVCTPPINRNKPKTEGEELFGLVLGGYGLFGIVTDVTLSVTDNVELEMDSLNVTLGKSQDDSQFIRIWDETRRSDEVNVKIARLNTLTLETASLYIFRRGYDTPTISQNLPLQPREMTKVYQLLYKWALPLLGEYRLKREASSGKPADVPKALYTRNELVYESATPISKLYSPLVLVDDTFVLQEFFVPRERFTDWIQAVRPIYQDINDYQADKRLVLLNTTIRFVEYDEKTFLNYSRAKHGMFAFVLYYRINRSKEVDKDLGDFHNRLAREAINLGGTFYLPYRNCYTTEMFTEAYPQIREFCEYKEKFDPLAIFSNEWFETSLLPLCSRAYRSAWSSGPCIPKQSRIALPSRLPTLKEFKDALPRSSDPLLERRDNSYRKLLKNKRLRREFAEQFLVKIFHVEKPDDVMRAMVQAAWDPRNADDDMIYAALYQHFHKSTGPSSLLSQLGTAWRSVYQLNHQKIELTREIISILSRTGTYGRIRGYMSIGDHGKCVISLLESGALYSAPSDCGNRVVVAHEFGPDDEFSLPVILERGSLSPVGDLHINYNYMHDKANLCFKEVPSNSLDLITMNQGCHHIPQDELYRFLIEVERVMRPGGLFLMREHDVDFTIAESRPKTKRDIWRTQIEMLDLAHSVFNAVTGVSPKDDKSEIRAFRPIEEWKEILKCFGFFDVALYGIEKDDPTCDFMICFQKGCVRLLGGPIRDAPGTMCGSVSHAPTECSIFTPYNTEPAIFTAYKALVAQIPSSLLSLVEACVLFLVRSLPVAEKRLDQLLKLLSGELQPSEENSNSCNKEDVFDREIVNTIVSFLGDRLSQTLEHFVVLVSGLSTLLTGIKLRETADIMGILSMPELFLVMPTLQRRVEQRPIFSSDSEKLIVNLCKTYAPVFLQVDKEAEELAGSGPSDEPQPSIDTGRGFETMQEEIIATLSIVEEKIPALLNFAEFLPESGFTVAQQALILSSIGEPNIEAYATELSKYCDRQTWEDLRIILVGNTSAQCTSTSDTTVASVGDLPTRELLFSPKLQHPWYRAVKTILKSKRIELGSRSRLALKWIGLPELLSMYKEAKDEARKQPCPNTSLDLVISTQDAAILEDLLSPVNASHQIVKVRLDFTGSCRSYELEDVGDIVEARFGYKSLTSDYTDVTLSLRTYQAKLHKEMKALGESQSQVGRLPISEKVLLEFRNGSAIARLGDSMRKKIVGVGTIGLVGRNILKLKYRKISPDSTEKPSNEAVGQLCSFLEQKELITGNLHHNGEPYFVWFKLSEWMQVEIINKLGTSLDHTAWYWFPFIDFIRMYFDVLASECGIVASEYGLANAYMSPGFITDLVPGIVMALIFGQLKALAHPITKLFPEYNFDEMSEEVVFFATMPAIFRGGTITQLFQKVVDLRIADVTVLSSSQSNPSHPILYKAVVPTYKTMGEILINLAELVPSARLLQISGQKVTQVRVSIDASTQDANCTERVEVVKKALVEVGGTEVLFDYRYPNDRLLHRLQGETEDRILHISLRVQLGSLLNLIRAVAMMHDVTVEQIYEFWTGW